MKFYLISPRELAIPDYMRSFMQEARPVVPERSPAWNRCMPRLDVLYMTRIQRERFSDPLAYERNKGVYVLTRRKLARAKPDMMMLHPLPRVDEIALDVDDDPRALYFEQARCGMYARMALLMDLACQPHRRAGAGGHRHPSALPQPQLHHPDRALPAAPGEGDPGRALLRLLRPAAAGGRLSAVAEEQDSEKNS